jgi:hypothetical protein
MSDSGLSAQAGGSPIEAAKVPDAATGLVEGVKRVGVDVRFVTHDRISGPVLFVGAHIR